MPDQPDLPPELERSEVASLAADVLNGTPVDWDEASSAVGTDYATQFRVVAALAAVHRELQFPGSGDGPAVPVATGKGHASVGTWGPLTLLERIGQGAFGEVYRARDEALHREVALKLLRPTRSVEEGTATVEEGRLLARIQHDNVVRVFGAQRIGADVGLWTEFIHGRTLADIVRDQGRLSAQEAATLGIAICRALSAAHRVGVLHRDVKPQNVMREDGGRIVLLDFGCASRDWRPARGTGSDLAGTPWYLAPEVIAGQAPTPQADLYSLGVLLFFLVTGDVPVKGTSVEALRVVHGQGAGLKLRDARPDLPAAFVTVVERALRSNPADRFESAGAFETALAGTTGKQTPDHSGVLVWGRDHQWLVAALTPSLLALVGLAAFQWHRTPPPPPPAFVATQLTVASPEFPTLAAVAISPDGKFLAYVDPIGLKVQSPPNGDARRVVDLDEPINQIAWLPDSTGILLSGPKGVYRTSVFGDTLRQISERGGIVAVSRDGRVALTTDQGKTIHILSADFADHGEIAHAEGGFTFSSPSWSLDGRRIAYGVRSQLFGVTGKPNVMTIETRRFDGSERTEVYRGSSLLSYVWGPDDRILFVLPAQQPYGELWHVRVNGRTGQPVAFPERLWQPSEVRFSKPSTTADGRQLVYFTAHGASEIDVADFDPERLTLGPFRRALARELYSGPLAWTPSGDALLFHEAVPGSLQEVKRLPLAGGEPQVVVRNHRQIDSYWLTSDGRWLLYAEFGAAIGPPDQTGKRQGGAIIRAPVNGGPETPLFGVPIFSVVKCAVRAPQVCVAGAPSDAVHLSVFDPAVGQPRALASLPYDPASPSLAGSFDLTADGTLLAAIRGAGRDTSLVVINVASGQVQAVACAPCARASSVAWAPGNRGWIVTTIDAPGRLLASAIWYVDRRGTSKQLWQSAYQLISSPVLSPDGRRFAFTIGTMASSIWKLEGF